MIRAVVLLVMATTTACGAGAGPAHAPAPATTPDKVVMAPEPVAVQPTLRPSPRHLDRSYRAEPDLVDPGAGGVLRIKSLGIRAPVDAVGLDGSAMAVPDDPGRVGWLQSTAQVDDSSGASVLSGHVSDERDVPGALSRLNEVRRGAVITWAPPGGRRYRFEVVDLHTYPRATGVPAELFRVDGRHVLHLVTCARRVSTAGGGFHYTANLVVTARAVPG
ncbi:hypothetical protein ABIE44_002476 [Marmoricola sp. OAE513]|uniref:class F sortase n=1 Tax=Marmoricola sp. OAE513 TaxID=2817894 RepID=UPI001AE3C685